MKNISELIKSQETEIILEVHSPLAAMLAQKAGIKAVWLSSLTLSTSLGVRDLNELSWREVAYFSEMICDRIDIPLVVDLDSGHGDFNITRRIARKLYSVGTSAICIEDKLFPKENSFFQSNTQKLESINKFAGKISAVKDSAPELFVLARTESFITGNGLDEALERARAYQNAGADAVVVHSSRKDFADIEAFLKNWDGIPVVAIPTTYADVPYEVFNQAQLAAVIWATQMLKASFKAMEETAKSIQENKGPYQLPGNQKTVEDFFAISNMDEFAAAKEKYGK